MIVFNLKCKDCSYEFEAWFSDSKEYKKQIKQKLIYCPSCNNSSIIKSLVLPLNFKFLLDCSTKLLVKLNFCS